MYFTVAFANDLAEMGLDTGRIRLLAIGQKMEKKTVNDVLFCSLMELVAGITNPDELRWPKGHLLEYGLRP